ncbi:hypothetical protein UVI_02024620 [Ustilaginoidea virens]|uniref:ubiquitinyl hydrolase 1 n=1 Tax=Ustilaginoidea virens TaxID=1159556 RepID=A0A1B5KQX5_USTVR|nr:hypothetical protein UVI_02024620 [Ustilaginoidea virens]
MMILEEGNTGHRMVIIPQGKVQCQEANPGSPIQHVTVEIDVQQSRETYAYDLDANLGQLVGRSLQSRLVLAYLHALTSYCLPDPLTGYTGTEQALNILRSAQVLSLQTLSAENHHVLLEIAELKGHRKLSPPRMGKLQIVSWVDGLGALSHRYDFHVAVKDIFKQSTKYRLFHADRYIEPPSFEENEAVELGERNATRTAMFHSPGFGGEAHSTAGDEPYVRLNDEYLELIDHRGGDGESDEPGDSEEDENVGSSGTQTAGPFSDRFKRAYKTCITMVAGLQGTKVNFFKKSKLRTFKSRMLKVLGSHHNIPTAGPLKKDTNFDFNYDTNWLDDPAIFLPNTWFRILHSLQHRPSRSNEYRARFFLATLSFSPHSCMEAIQILASAMCGQLKTLQAPQVEAFSLNKGCQPKRKDLERILQKYIIPFPKSSHSRSPVRRGESQNACKSRRKREYEEAKKYCLETLPTVFIADWKSKGAHWPTSHDRFINLFNTSQMLLDIELHFRDVSNNEQLSNYFGTWHRELFNIEGKQVDYPIDVHPRAPCKASVHLPAIDGKLLFNSTTPPIFKEELQSLSHRTVPVQGKTSPQASILVELLRSKACSSEQMSYVKELQQSLDSLQGATLGHVMKERGAKLRMLLSSCLRDAKIDGDNLFERMKEALGCVPKDHGSQLANLKALAFVQQMPPIGKRFLLQQLSHLGACSNNWQACLLVFAENLSRVRLWERLNLFEMESNKLDLDKEAVSLQPRNWDPHLYPEWLLFEVENNIRVRNAQAQMAEAMMFPLQDRNSVMQLNMGEGKSSVIVPIIATSLADGKRLVRVIVAKPQSKQMEEIMKTKLGNALGRRIYFMPFSRAVPVDEQAAKELHSMLEECIAKKGVLIIQPEHDLSLQLMICDCFNSGRLATGNALCAIKRLFDNCSRDIIDESDEVFSPKYELVYPLGISQPVDFSTERCSFIQSMLAIVAKVAPEVKEEAPNGIEVSWIGKGRFPRIRLFTSEASDCLVKKVGEEICRSGFAELPIHRVPEQLKSDLLSYMTMMAPTAETCREIENGMAKWNSTMRKAFYLARGLLACEVLSTALRHRWRVNYGVDKNRNPKLDIAVPFRAKDAPSLRSEYSYADTVITKTCLSYYYQGLEYEDFFLALVELFKSEQSEPEYEAWVRSTEGLHADFRHIQGVNVNDEDQCKTMLFPHLRYSKACIDYFLLRIVFAKQLREYSEKVSASGWDLARPKTFPTTGFSGTHDSRPLLPLHITQRDSDAQHHTDSLVLNQMMSPQNSVILLGEVKGSNSEEFLKRITEERDEIRVILDVGAHVIELTNQEVAGRWLELLPCRNAIDAVIFCNDNDELTVLDRQGKSQCLRLSPFAKQLNKCLVYLDEAHTRGIDLKLPPTYRAAVTLGKDLTKDRLAQDLGNGQSVAFCVPFEIENQIRAQLELDGNDQITLRDAIAWTVLQTWAEMRRLIPNWAKQGFRFEKQAQLWNQAKSNDSGTIRMTPEIVSKFKECDTRTIESQYQFPPPSGPLLEKEASSENLGKIKKRCEAYDFHGHDGHGLQEEQEREMATEVEEQRELERPKPAEPAKHQSNLDVVRFIRTGKISSDSKGIIGAFKSMTDTTAATLLNVNLFPQHVKVSRDFARVIKTTRNAKNLKSDYFKNDVQFILTSADEDKIVQEMVIISPYEAEILYNEISRSEVVALHIYSARQNSSYPAIDGLDLYIVPPRARRRIPTHMKIELNLFAGQLYFSTFKEYTEVCDFLSLSWSLKSPGDLIDGFIPRKGSSTNAPHGVNSKTSPVPFLKAFMTYVRNQGGNIGTTHMGKMLSGVYLGAEDFPSRVKREREEDDDCKESLFTR